MKDGSLHCFASTPDHAFGVCRNLIVDVWRREMTVEALEQLAREVSKTGLTGRQDLVLLTLVEAAAHLPSAAARQATAELLRRGAGLVCRAATVLEGDGFRAATTRSIAIGMSLLARQPFPYKVFSSVADAASWLSAERESGFERDEIAGALEQIRSWRVE